MPDYRLERMTLAGGIFQTLDIVADDDKHAVAEAVRLDHAPFVEIWSGARLVSRVAPGGVLY